MLTKPQIFGKLISREDSKLTWVTKLKRAVGRILLPLGPIAFMAALGISFEIIIQTMILLCLVFGFIHLVSWLLYSE